LFGFLAIGPATQDIAQAQAEKRQQLMKSQSADVKAIKAAVTGRTLEPFERLLGKHVRLQVASAAGPPVRRAGIAAPQRATASARRATVRG
jgi:hypothetical protein